MKIAIVTGFDGYDSAYSLCSVVLDQVAGLTRMGHEVQTWDLANCHAVIPKRLAASLTPCIPVHAMHTQDIDADKVEIVADALEDQIRSFKPDVIVCHDTVFQVAMKTICEGLARARAHFPSLPAVHMMHSCTGDEGPRWGRRCIRDGDRVVYGDRLNLDVIARGFGIDESRITVMHMPRDFGLSAYLTDEVDELIRRHRLHERDIVQVFPASQPRLGHKGLPDAISVFECLKNKGKDVALIVCDPHARRDEADAYKSDVLGDDLIFTSRQGVERWKDHGLRPRELTGLRTVTNLFVWPSRAEMSSLAVKEAMLAGELLVLNGSVPTNRELARNDAIYVAWPEYRTMGGGADGPALAERIIERLDGCSINRQRRRALREFSADTHARQLMSVIEEIA